MHRVMSVCALAAALMLVACGQSLEPVADLLRPPSVSEIEARVADLARNGNVAEALKKGEDFLAKQPDPRGELHNLLARLYTESGDTQSALRHLQAMGAVDSSTDAKARAPVASEAPLAPNAPAPPTAPRQSTGFSAEVEGAAARVTDTGVEARAGRTFANVPK